MHPQVCWAAHCLPGGRSQGGLLAHVLFPVPGPGSQTHKAEIPTLGLLAPYTACAIV